MKVKGIGIKEVHCSNPSMTLSEIASIRICIELKWKWHSIQPTAL